MAKIYWWGYLHSNNSMQLKRWHGDHKDYQDDCIGNPNVKLVIEPFEANNNEEAMEILADSLREKIDGSHNRSVKSSSDEIQIAFC